MKQTLCVCMCVLEIDGDVIETMKTVDRENNINGDKIKTTNRLTNASYM